MNKSTPTSALECAERLLGEVALHREDGADQFATDIETVCRAFKALHARTVLTEEERDDISAMNSAMLMGLPVDYRPLCVVLRIITRLTSPAPEAPTDDQLTERALNEMDGVEPAPARVMGQEAHDLIELKALAAWLDSEGYYASADLVARAADRLTARAK